MQAFRVALHCSTVCCDTSEVLLRTLHKSARPESECDRALHVVHIKVQNFLGSWALNSVLPLASQRPVAPIFALRPALFPCCSTALT